MFAGWNVLCPSCHQLIRVPGEKLTKVSASHQQFNNQIFKWPRWKKNCVVKDDQNREVGVFKLVGALASIGKLLLVTLLTIVIFIGSIVLMVVIDPQLTYIWFSLPLMIAVMLGVFFLLDKKKFARRHWVFYSAQNSTTPFFKIKFVRKYSLTKYQFNVIDAEGTIIAVIEEYLLDFLRNIWSVKDSRQQILFTVKEESLILALIRRLPLLSWINLIPIDYIILARSSESVRGEIMGAFRHTKLDLSEDFNHEIDQRLALAVSQIIMRRV